MRRIITIIFLVASCLLTHAQETCQVSGIVRYEFNDYVGYRPDLGAKVHFIRKSANDTIPQLKLWEEYEDLAHRGMMYAISMQKAKRDGIDSADFDGIMRKNWRFQKAEEDRVKELDKILLKERFDLLEDEDNVALIDASGMYSISLPKGEYYAIFVSANRDRKLWLTELLGRIHVTLIELKGSSKIVSYDFDY